MSQWYTKGSKGPQSNAGKGTARIIPAPQVVKEELTGWAWEPAIASGTGPKNNTAKGTVQYVKSPQALNDELTGGQKTVYARHRLAGKGTARVIPSPKAAQQESAGWAKASGKGAKGNAGKGNAQFFTHNPQDIEAEFTGWVNALFDNLYDLATPNEALQPPWQCLMRLRTQVLQAYATAPVHQTTLASAPPNANGSPMNWKQEFYNEFSRQQKKSPSKDDITIEVQEVEGGGFLATLSCSMLSQEYQGEEVMPSKKKAEEMACKAALEAELPDVFERLSAPQAQWPAAAEGQGKKRKAAQMAEAAAAPLVNVEPPQPDNAKARLNQVAQLLKGSPLAKGDILYECVEVEGGFVATVTLAPADAIGEGETVWEGTAAASKKQAETNAAEVALDALKDQVEPLEEEHRAKKAKLKRESLEKFRQKKAAEAGEAAEAEEQEESGA